MKKKLHRIYWLGMLVTLLATTSVVALIIVMRVNDTRQSLRMMTHAAREWIMDSSDSLQSLANEISSLSPPLRVTFLMDHGLVLADSEYSTLELDNHFDRPEVQQALKNNMGESLRFSDVSPSLTLYVATRLSSGLILRFAYPLTDIIHILLGYALALTALFLILYVVQRRSLKKFADSMLLQLEDVRALLEGSQPHLNARFPELKPAIDHISYLATRLHEDLNEVNRTLNLRTDFVAHASHELRSPLTSISGFAEMLDEGMADSPEETALCISAIRNECQRMLSVIEDILHLSHAESDTPPEMQLVPLRRLTDEIISALHPQAVQKHISLLAAGEMQLWACEKDMWEILYNLMSNAVKYGRENGFVRVTLHDNTIVVEDDGIGIAPEHLPHLFEQFYRVDDARGMTQSGTGLGLSIVKALCARYNAAIRVESTLNVGSRFILEFPAPAKEVTNA